MKRMIGGIVVAMVLGLVGLAAAEDTWHSGAYDPERGTNFANPTGYQRMIPHQGAGGDGAAGGDAGDGGATGASSGGSTGGESGGEGTGDGCGPK